MRWSYSPSNQVLKAFPAIALRLGHDAVTTSLIRGDCRPSSHKWLSPLRGLNPTVQPPKRSQRARHQHDDHDDLAGVGERRNSRPGDRCDARDSRGPSPESNISIFKKEGCEWAVMFHDPISEDWRSYEAPPLIGKTLGTKIPCNKVSCTVEREAAGL